MRLLLVAGGKHRARVHIWVFWQVRGVGLLEFSRNVSYNFSEHKFLQLSQSMRSGNGLRQSSHGSITKQKSRIVLEWN